MSIEQLESRTLLSTSPWGEVLYQGTVNQVEALSGGDILVVGSEYQVDQGEAVLVSTISRLASDGTVIWQLEPDMSLGYASVATSGDTDVIWLSSSEGLVRVSPDGVLEVFAQEAGRVAALSDGRVAFQTGTDPADMTLRFLEADGDLEPSSVELSGFRFTDMAADAQDNLFVIGYTSDPNPASTPDVVDDLRLFDGIVQKYDPFGTLLWQRRYDVGDFNVFQAVDVDSAGNVWIAAKLQPQGGVLPFVPGGEAVAGPSYIRAISYSADGLLSASPILYAGDSIETDYTSLDINAADERVVVTFRVDRQDFTSIMVGVQGDEVAWRSAITGEVISSSILAPDGQLLYIRLGGNGSALVSVDEYRHGSTFFVPGSIDDDVITVQVKGERIVAQRGNERIITYVEGLTDVSVRLRDGNDSFTAPVPFNVTARGGIGDDTIITGHGQDTLFGGDGNDLIQSHGRADSISGGNGRDTIYGGAGDDHIVGDDAMDLLFGEGGNDWLSEDEGNDTVLRRWWMIP